MQWMAGVLLTQILLVLTVLVLSVSDFDKLFPVIPTITTLKRSVAFGRFFPHFFSDSTKHCNLSKPLLLNNRLTCNQSDLLNSVYQLRG